MISRRDVEKLLGMHAPEATVLSLYVTVPKDPDARRGLAARADGLLALASPPGPAGGGTATARDENRRTALSVLEQRAGDWLGHTAAIFVSGRLGLREAHRLPCPLPERAVVAARPHVRPLLAALQRCPAYRIAVVDRRHAWVLAVTGERIETLARTDAEGVRSPGFGGWYGLESHRVHERVIQLARHHYHDTAAVLEQAVRSEPQPLVIGGHEQTIPAFLATLPQGVRDHYVGRFTADPHTLTPARARALAGPLVGDWVQQAEENIVRALAATPPGPLTVFGMNACLAAVNQHAVSLLVVPIGGMVPGYVCEQCGALTAEGDCPRGHDASQPVPDLIEDMAVATLADGGQVQAVHDPPADIAARLRFPVTGEPHQELTHLSDTESRS